ncbi:hypothetical protein HBI81_115110 [Parastagonospora nodorum]|nr:hypothetical protein HBH43_197010 [Parastagonospora nodorum]KAH5079474.1 hypothetical protein HBI73_169200 [Parastagonospora nodorum]KAH6038916.1 hypothetical protein HBI54_168380 [Parastagonospora nodorum]KAH6527661.1 hypothetical protein HBI81_115110 [Parastagonospora nodorum]
MFFHRVYMLSFIIRTYESPRPDQIFRFPSLYSPMCVRQKLPQKTKFLENHMQDSRAQCLAYAFVRDMLEPKGIASTDTQISSVGKERRPFGKVFRGRIGLVPKRDIAI